MNIPRSALKAVSLAMGLRDIRVYLNGMLVQCSGRTVRLVATDGYRLHMIDLPQEVPCPPLVEGAIIPRALIEWALKNSKPGQSVQITTDGAAVTIASGGASMSGAAVDGRYPDYDRILPRGVPTGKVAQFNPQYVSDAYAAVKELAGKGDLFPTLRHTGAYVAATVAYERFLAAIMPLRDTMGHEPDARLFAPVADPVEE